jgi:hypothetical protein
MKEFSSFLGKVGSTKNFPKFVFRTTKEKCALLGRPIPTREALLYSIFRSDVKDIFFVNSKNSIFFFVFFFPEINSMFL